MERGMGAGIVAVQSVPRSLNSVLNGCLRSGRQRMWQPATCSLVRGCTHWINLLVTPCVTSRLTALSECHLTAA
jgi:hypothetical protein